MNLDIIICTYNRAFLLDACLTSVIAQIRKMSREMSCEMPDVHLWVVDNNSSDNTAALVARYTTEYPDIVRYVFEPAQGLSQARNRGITASSAPWLAFLDDEAILESGWLASGLDVINSGDFDCFGGVFLAHYPFPGKPDWLAEDFGTNQTLQNHYGPLPPDKTPAGGNMFCRRGALLEAGGFPVNLGMGAGGKKVAYGEETFMCRQMRKNGGRIGFVPDLIIHHSVVPEKYRMGWHFRSEYTRGRDDLIIHDLPASKGKAIALLLSLPLIMLRDSIRGGQRLWQAGRLNAQSLYFFVVSRAARRIGRSVGHLR